MTTQKGSTSLSTEENKAVVRRFIEEIFNTGNVALAEDLFALEMVERVHAVIPGFHRAFPDWHITIEEQIAEGDKVVTRWTGRGTHHGQLWDFSPTGKLITWHEIYIMRLVDGKIAEAARENNFIEVIEQLGGKIVPPEQASS
jgi:predicted ester cyclase